MSLSLGLLRMIRPVNCAMMGLAVIVGEVMALGGGFLLWPALIGFAVGFLLLGAAMTTNDYFDVDIDRVNQPERPLPSGSVKPSQALWAAAILITGGLLLAATINLFTFGIAALSQMLMAYYNARGKRTGLPGNVVVSVNVGIPFVFGGFAVGNMNLALGFFTLLSFLSSLGREVTKGIADIPGDSKIGVRTVAVKSGPKTASRVAALFFLLAVLLSLLPLVTRVVSWVYIPWVIACDTGFVYTSLSLLRKTTAENARRQKQLALVWMMLGLLAFLFGALDASRLA